MKLDPYLSLKAKINSIYVKDLIIKPEMSRGKQS